MAEFNAMDTAAFKGVWVFCEQREGEIQSISYQLLSEGRKLANDLGVELAGVVMGSGLAEADLKTLGGYGADRVYNIDSPLLKDYTTDGYAKALCDLIMDKKPEIMLIGATNLGRDLGPRCAARLHTGLCADCTHLDVDMPIYKDFLRGASTLPEAKIDGMATAKVMGKDHDVSRDLKMTRPAFGGNLMATIICPRFRPSMATVRPGVMKKAAYDEAKAISRPRSSRSSRLPRSSSTWLALTTSSPSAVVSPRTSRAASSSLTSSPTCSAALLAAPVWPSTPAGSLPTIRSVRPVRPSTRRSTLLSVSPAPSSTRPV